MTEAKAFLPFRRWRVIALILFTILLHLLVVSWGKEYFNAAPVDDPAQSSVTVTLRPLEQPKQPVSLPVAAAPKKPRPKPAASPKPAPAPVTTPAPTETATAVSSDAPVVVDAAPTQGATGPATPPATAAAPETKEDKTAAPPATSEGTHYQIDPPPSALLEYEVLAFSDNLNWHGTSTLAWRSDGGHYSVEGEVYARMFAKFTFLNFTSTGDINEFGVAPELYTEKKRNRPATNTHFNRERKLVSFSASTNSYPRVGGEQDRASLIWQLAGIGRGDAGKFAPGSVIDMFVAGVRDGEVWRMQVVGLEDIRLVDGTISAWHVARQPRPGSYDQRLDIWLAPDRQWYPVRLRFTETNGDYLELSLSNLKPL